MNFSRKFAKMLLSFVIVMAFLIPSVSSQVISGGGLSVSSPVVSNGSEQGSQLQSSNAQGTQVQKSKSLDAVLVGIVTSSSLPHITVKSQSQDTVSGEAVSAPPSPHVTVDVPNGGENWYRGSSYDITWSSYYNNSCVDSSSGYVKIELYKDGVFYSTITSSTANNGIYNWYIPPGQVAASTYKVKIIIVSTPSIYDYSNSTFTISSKASIGTFWWYRNDGGLLYAQGDAEGLGSILQADGCTWSINKNDVENELYDYYLQEGSNELIDNVDLAYFIGHSGSKALGIYKPFSILDPNCKVEYYNCKWGDDGPNKWVVLSTCLAAQGYFATALHGTHMILGWSTPSDDAFYGPVFANYIKSGMTLKEAWFKTAEECQHVPATAQIIGEDLSVGNDHLKGYGDYVSSVTPDSNYYYWSLPVSGWQDDYNWILPSGYKSGPWSNEENAFDNNNQTYAKFQQAQNGWSDPLTLTLGTPNIIGGFRIMAGKPNPEYDSNHDEIPSHDQIRLKFYRGTTLETTVTVTNWEDGSWRIIDFADGSPYQVQTSISGDRKPVVDRVEIQVHECDPDYGFAVKPAKIYEINFMSLGVPPLPPILPGVGSSVVLVKSQQTLGQSMLQQTMGMGMAQRGSSASGSVGSIQASGYSAVPESYSSTKFASIATKLGITGTPQYVDNQLCPATYVEKGNGKTLNYNTKTGTWSYSDPSKAYPTVSKEPVLPSDAQAINIATQFMKDNGLYSDKISGVTVTYQKQGCGIKGTDKILYEWIITKTVCFSRQTNGIPILDKTTVTIGENDDVVSFFIPTQTIEVTQK